MKTLADMVKELGSKNALSQESDVSDADLAVDGPERVRQFVAPSEPISNETKEAFPDLRENTPILPLDEFGVSVEAVSSPSPAPQYNDEKNMITHLPLDDLDPYDNDPFREYEGQALAALTDSIRERGVLSPILVRPKSNGRYEILSGRHRRKAAKLAGLIEAPCIICVETTDDQAILIVTETNLMQRENLLPSEKAFAYKMLMEALKREGGKLKNEGLISDSDGENRNNSRDGNLSESTTSIYRYISLTRLIPSLLSLVDDSTLGIMAAEQLSPLSLEEQEIILTFFFEQKKGSLTPSVAGQIRQRSMEVEITPLELEKLVGKAVKSTVPKAYSVPIKKIEKYIPAGTKKKEAEKIILTALEYYFSHSTT